MSKSTTTYWNALSPENRERWISIKGMEGMAEELTLSVDDVTGEYTRLTRFLPGANTTAFGGKSHPYPEEVFIVSGRLYDQAFDLWLDAGHYASRPPAKFTVRSRPTSGVLCWKCHSPIALVTAMLPIPSFHPTLRDEASHCR